MIARRGVSTEVVIVLNLKDLPGRVLSSGANGFRLNAFAANHDRARFIAADHDVKQGGDDFRGQHELVACGREHQVGSAGDGENNRAIFANFIQRSVEYRGHAVLTPNRHDARLRIGSKRIAERLGDRGDGKKQPSTAYLRSAVWSSECAFVDDDY